MSSETALDWKFASQDRNLGTVYGQHLAVVEDSDQDAALVSMIRYTHKVLTVLGIQHGPSHAEVRPRPIRPRTSARLRTVAGVGESSRPLDISLFFLWFDNQQFALI